MILNSWIFFCRKAVSADINSSSFVLKVLFIYLLFYGTGPHACKARPPPLNHIPAQATIV
jgi:hypothetical protein